MSQNVQHKYEVNEPKDTETRLASGDVINQNGIKIEDIQQNPSSADETQIPEWTKYKDGKRAWLVVIAAFSIQVVVVGILHIFGVFFVALVAEFNATKGDAAWVGSASYGLSMAFGPVCSYLINRFGNQVISMTGCVICTVSLVTSSFAPNLGVLYASFSVMYGIGLCLAYTPTMCFAGIYFDRYQTVATGIMVAGSSTGTLVLAPIAQKLVSEYGWRTAFRIFAGAVFLCTFSAYMFKPLPGMPKRAPPPPPNVSMQKWSPLKDKVFMVFTLSIMLVQFGYYIPYVHLVARAEDLGIPPQKASLLVMILGGTTAFSRVSFGKIIAMLKMNRIHLHQLSMVITGTAFMLLPLVQTFSGLAIYVICVGLIDGCYVVLLPTNTAMLMGPKNVVLAWGFLIGFSSITFTLGPPCAGWMYDALGSYDVAFHIAGIPVVWGAIVLFFIPLAQRHSKGPSAVDYIEMNEEVKTTASSISSEESVQTVRSRDSFEIVSKDDISNSVSDRVSQTIEILKRTSHSMVELEKQLPGGGSVSLRSSKHSHINKDDVSLRSPPPLRSPTSIYSGRNSQEEFPNIALSASEMERRLQRSAERDGMKSPTLSTSESTRQSSSHSIPIAVGFPGIPTFIVSPGNTGNDFVAGPGNNYDDMEVQQISTSPGAINSPITMNFQPLVVSPTSPHFTAISNVSLAPVVEEEADTSAETVDVDDAPSGGNLQTHGSSTQQEPMFNMSDLSLT